MKNLNRDEKKIFILSICLVIYFFIGCIAEMQGQSYTHDPKLISLLPTENKKKEIEVKNNSAVHDVYIIYKCKEDDRYWTEVGTVSVFSNTVAKFYVEDGFEYGAAPQWEKPKKLGAQSKKRWRTPKKRDRYRD